MSIGSPGVLPTPLAPTGTELSVLQYRTIRLIEPPAAWPHTFAINANSMTVEKTDNYGALSFEVHLLNSGVMQLSASTNLYAMPEPTLTFYAPIRQTFSGTYGILMIIRFINSVIILIIKGQPIAGPFSLL